jgi:hypothetical protein
MDAMLERLRLEAEDERRKVYLEKFGNLPEMKERNRLLKDFN